MRVRLSHGLCFFDVQFLADLTGSFSRPKNPSKTWPPQGPPPQVCWVRCCHEIETRAGECLRRTTRQSASYFLLAKLPSVQPQQSSVQVCEPETGFEEVRRKWLQRPGPHVYVLTQARRMGWPPFLKNCAPALYTHHLNRKRKGKHVLRSPRTRQSSINREYALD